MLSTQLRASVPTHWCCFPHNWVEMYLYTGAAFHTTGSKYSYTLVLFSTQLGGNIVTLVLFSTQLGGSIFTH